MPLHSMDRKQMNFEYIMDPEKLRDIMLVNACAKLEHAAGSRYVDAVKICPHRTMWKGLEHWEHWQTVGQKKLVPISNFH